MRVYWLLLIASCSGPSLRQEGSPFIATVGSSLDGGEHSSSLGSSSLGSSSSGDSTFLEGDSSSEALSSSTGTQPGPSTTGEESTSSTGSSSSSSSSSGDSSATGTPETTSEMGTTGSETTGETQPLVGLYQQCLKNAECPQNTNGCFTISDEDMMMVVDGFCTLYCTKDEECGPKGMCSFILGVNTCILPCKFPTDCPQEMDCYPTQNMGGVEHMCI